MDNKYALGSTKVATEIHRSGAYNTHICKYCQYESLLLSQTMHDHCCPQCGRWQEDIPIGYSTGRSSDY